MKINAAIMTFLQANFQLNWLIFPEIDGGGKYTSSPGMGVCQPRLRRNMAKLIYQLLLITFEY